LTQQRAATQPIKDIPCVLHALIRNGHTGPHAGMNNGSPRALPLRTAA